MQIATSSGGYLEILKAVVQLTASPAFVVPDSGTYRVRASYHTIFVIASG